jgi:predicted ABC-type ATPase
MPKKELVNNNPILIIIAGPNGSGKTSITTQF